MLWTIVLQARRIINLMKKFGLPAFIAGLGLLIGTAATAQNSDFEIGITASAYYYKGDITQSSLGTLKKPKPGIGVFATKVVGSNLSFRLNADFTQLKASDAEFGKESWKANRNLAFKTTLLEFGVRAIYDFKDNYENESDFRPYLFGGVGAAMIHVTRDYSKFNTAFYTVRERWVLPGLNQDIATTLPKFIVTFPVGAGMKYAIGSSTWLIAEGSYRFTLTDYLDGFSKVGHQKRDHYYSASIGIAFALGEADSY